MLIPTGSHNLQRQRDYRAANSRDIAEYRVHTHGYDRPDKETIR